MTITITSKNLTEDGLFVHVVLSNGDESNITIDWASEYVQDPYEEIVIYMVDETYVDENGDNQTRQVEQSQTITKWRDSTKTLLEYELEQAPIKAQERADAAAAKAAKVASILGA